jgi:hypothetical protein
MSNEMIAVCGLDCAGCPAHLAWKNDDEPLRVKTAAEWSQAYHFECTSSMINCSGCRAADGPKIMHCAQCKMRACAVQKGHDTCAACPEFDGCAEIQGFLANVAAAKANLERLRAESRG